MGALFEWMLIAIAGPFMESHEGSQYLVTAIDKFIE
jgi:hypothetical protein